MYGRPARKCGEESPNTIIIKQWLTATAPPVLPGGRESATETMSRTRE